MKTTSASRCRTERRRAPTATTDQDPSSSGRPPGAHARTTGPRVDDARSARSPADCRSFVVLEPERVESACQLHFPRHANTSVPKSSLATPVPNHALGTSHTSHSFSSTSRQIEEEIGVVVSEVRLPDRNGSAKPVSHRFAIHRFDACAHRVPAARS